MAKAKAPAWLTTTFAEGVVELALPRPAPAYKGALGRCWLARHDPRRRPCSGPFERFHFISRQRVENALGALLPYVLDITFNDDRSVNVGGSPPPVDGLGRIAGPPPIAAEWRDEIILLAAWDPRNGGVGCEGHHRRYDSHLTPSLIIPRDVLPSHVEQFAFDWGIEGELERFLRVERFR